MHSGSYPDRVVLKEDGRIWCVDYMKTATTINFGILAVWRFDDEGQLVERVVKTGEYEHLKEDSPPYYDHTYNGVRLDPYRIMQVYGITHPAQQHAIKKLLRAGKKARVSVVQEIDDAIASLERWKAMIEEDGE